MVLNYTDSEDRELKLLLELTRFPFVSITTEDIEEVNWERFFRIATTHKVAMLVYSRLKTAPLIIPEEAFTAFEVHCKKALLTNLQNTQCLLELYDITSKEGIAIIPYKGAVFAQEVYGGIELRESSDVDFWFPLYARKQLAAVMSHLGFRHGQLFKDWQHRLYHQVNCEYTFVKFRRGVRTLVEPHYHLINHFIKIPLSEEQVASQMQTIHLSGRVIKTFSPAMMLLYLATHHGATEGWHKLKNYTDVAAFVHRYRLTIDWEDALVWCARYELENIIMIGLMNAAQLYQIELPQAVQNRVTSQLTQQADWVLRNAKAFKGRFRGVYKFQMLWITRPDVVSKVKLLRQAMYYLMMRGIYALVSR